VVIEPFAGAMMAHPVMSLSDVVDGAILAAYWSDPCSDIEPRRLLPVLDGLLAIADLRVGQCCTNAERADKMVCVARRVIRQNIASRD
jgi:hypothetical protein